MSGGWPPDTPGREISDPDVRAGVTDLVLNQGWGYRKPKGGGYPQLYPPDGGAMIRVVKPGHTKGSGPRNFAAQVRRAGGIWQGRGKTEPEEGR